MKVKLIKSDKKNLQFSLEDSTIAFANALRRVLISQVPVLAINDVTFIENSSAFYDEFIAHRLGLIPLKGDIKGLNLPNECSCKGKGCAKCQVKFTLIKKGPGMVYSGDLKGPAGFSVADDKIPIVKLGEGQKIKLEATAVLGVGKDHAKWQPGVISYGYDDPKRITFTIESYGGLDPKQIVLSGIKVLKKKAKDFKSALRV